MQNLSKTISSVSTDMQVVLKQKSAFTGKKILFLGDSITALNTSERGWVRYFNEIIQPEKFVNLSVSSARWCDYEDSVYDGNPVFSGPDQNHNNVMGNQVEKLIRGKDKTSPHYKEVTAYADFDMILIACGTNDGVPSGDMEGSFTSENEMVAIEELTAGRLHQHSGAASKNFSSCTRRRRFISVRRFRAISRPGAMHSPRRKAII